MTKSATKSCSVPTKQGDEDRLAVIHLVEESHHKHEDAFSRYSNDLYRMKSLLLLQEDLEVEDDDGDDDLDTLAAINRAFSSVGLSDIAHLNRDKRRRGNDSRCIQQGYVRKTRLSFELHPNLLLHDFIMELEAMGSGSHRIFDDEEESSEQQPQREVQEQEAP